MATAVSGKDRDERLIGLLRTVGVLREFNDRELHVVKSLTSLWAFDAGECILREGEPGSALCIVEDGACTREIGGRVVKFFDRGEVFLISFDRACSALKSRCCAVLFQPRLPLPR